MSRFIMIDLETFGSVPGCAIASIGAVAASPDGWITDRFYILVSRADCAAIGLHEDSETLAWWDRQSKEARAVLHLSAETSVTVVEALGQLNAFVESVGKNVEVYGNGSDFDNAILAVAARAAGVKLAWPFWMNRCYRTMKSRALLVKLARTGTHHNALDDAATQAEHLGRINRALAVDGDTIVAANVSLGHMADRYRERTARRIFGFRLPTMRRSDAMNHALATFDANLHWVHAGFGDPAFAWDRDGARELVDEDLQHWEAE